MAMWVPLALMAGGAIAEGLASKKGDQEKPKPVTPIQLPQVPAMQAPAPPPAPPPAPMAPAAQAPVYEQLKAQQPWNPVTPAAQDAFEKDLVAQGRELERQRLLNGGVTSFPMLSQAQQNQRELEIIKQGKQFEYEREHPWGD